MTEPEIRCPRPYRRNHVTLFWNDVTAKSNWFGMFVLYAAASSYIQASKTQECIGTNGIMVSCLRKNMRQKII